MKFQCKSDFSLMTLQNNTSFRSIMNHGQNGGKWITPNFIMFLCPQSLVSELRQDENRLLFGVVASKKIGNAVARNRAKRRLRHLVHGHITSLIASSEDTKNTSDFKAKCLVLIARKSTLTVPHEILQKDLKWALKRLKSNVDSAK